ncbi:MAG: amylo-alpha-1,6-glucosidase [Bacteroidetes bacterium]|nr:MAG: amylo-alpha-1,6-glucosidase [Bacteroidota bacterium]
MSYIKIEKDKLVNLEYTLNKEILRSNRGGSYASTTLSACNTRKYHGLLVVPCINEDEGKILLLSSLDETIIQNDNEFRLSIHQYQDDVFYPHGHRYISGFEAEPIPAKTYRVGGVILKKELLLSEKEKQILIRYTVVDAHSKTTLRLQPLTAFRNIHELSKENLSVNNKKEEIQNGIKVKMYKNYPALYMQCSKKMKFITAPDWNKNIIYREEKRRGYDFTEDLFTYGYFEANVKKGDKIIFSAGLKEINTSRLSTLFISELKKRTPRNSFENNLKNSGEQFFYYRNKSLKIIAGFPWYQSQLRESLLTLTGLSLPDDIPLFHKAFDTILKQFFEEKEENIAPDIPLLIIRTLQEYTTFADNCEEVWKKYRTKLLKLFRNIKDQKYNAFIHDNGLLYIPEDKPNYTWMNEYAYGEAVTPRTGFAVEINALWYNALMYLSALAEINNSKILLKELDNLPEKAKHFFNEVFSNEKEDSLFDFVNSKEQNNAIRPNQIFAVSLAYSPLSDRNMKKVLTTVKSHLLTKKGLRTLSPMHPLYKGKYIGNNDERNKARHQGTVHPWLIAEYCSANFNLYKEQSLKQIETIYNQFEVEMNTHGMGSISELFDGNPPHKPNGAISYAPSVAALLKIKMLLDTAK